MSGTVGPRISPFQNTYSLDFDGVDDYVEIGTQSLGITEAISISAWVKIPISGGWGAPYVEEIVGEDGTSGINWSLTFRPPPFFNYFAFTVYHTNGTSTTLTSSGVTPNDGQWHHLLGVSDGTTNANGVKLYVDGVLNVQATAASTGTRNTPTVIPTIGSTSNNSWYFEGNIDEVSIFDTDQSSNIDTLSTAPTVDLTDLNPIAWYRNGDNGSWKSPQWLIPNNENKDKVSNYSTQFDGIGDYIELGKISHLQNTTEYSISSWFKGALNNLYQAVYAWFDGADGYLQLLLVNDGSFTVYNYRTSTAYGVTAPGIVSADTWYNALVVFDGSGATNDDRLKLYINGSLITFASFVGTIPTQTGTMLINGMQIGSQQGLLLFEGNIDEVSIFDSAISIGDVWDGSGKPTDVSAVSGLANYYKMGEDATFSGGVWTVPDAVGSNDGTSVNMTIEDRVGTAPSSSNNALSFNMDLIDRVEDTPATP